MIALQMGLHKVSGANNKDDEPAERRNASRVIEGTVKSYYQYGFGSPAANYTTGFIKYRIHNPQTVHRRTQTATYSLNYIFVEYTLIMHTFKQAIEIEAPPGC